MTATASLPNASASTVLSDIWRANAERCGNTLALWNPHSKPEEQFSYRELYDAIQDFAGGLQALGVGAGARVAIVADNSPRWFVADQGSLMMGAVNVPRGATAPVSELAYILEHSGSSAIVAQDAATLQPLIDSIQRLGIELAILLSDESTDALPELDAVKWMTYREVLALGTARKFAPVDIERSHLATIIYTSGTTGNPKGVMLSHGNLMHQVENLRPVVNPAVGDRVLTILPTWHSYERSGEYYLLSRGCTQIYTTRRYIKQDLQQYSPSYMIAVPRIWETVYEGVQRQLREAKPFMQKLVKWFLTRSERWVLLRRQLQGRSLVRDRLSPVDTFLARLQWLFLTPIHFLGDRIVYRKIRQAVGSKFNHAISGGGALPPYLDAFYEIVGIDILVGYGLTETSPVLSARRPERNVRGTSGPPVPYTELQICHPDTLQPLPRGTTMLESRNYQGLIRARGPQIMQGYYRNLEATEKAIDAEGWFNTGDLGWLTPDGDIVITGRAKDVIVLTNGENIEPQPIEDACSQSESIDQIVLVGQDQKRLAALVYPNVKTLLGVHRDRLAPAATKLTSNDDLDVWVQHPEIISVLAADSETRSQVLNELQTLIKARPGYRPDDLIGDLRFIPEPLTMNNGLMTQTYKIRRNRVAERYVDLIAELYS
ncbi:MAG: AMP-binding protein [Cyanobacteria bacterium P01_D01_bin.123]